MSRHIKAPEGRVQQGQQPLFQRRPLRWHAPRCVCGALIQWCGHHAVPFDRSVWAGEATTEGEEGAVQAVRIFSDPEYPVNWWHLVGEPNPRHIMPPLHPVYRLHACSVWDGAILTPTPEKR